MATNDDRAGAVNNDPDVRAAMSGNYGRWASFAATLPTAWSTQTRNMVVAQQVAREKGLDTSGLDMSGTSAHDANSDPWYLKPQYAIPMVLGGGIGLGALGGAGSAAGAGGASGSGAGIAAGTGADMAGVTSGLGTAALPGAGTALGGAGTASLLGAGTDAAANSSWDSAGNFIGKSTVNGLPMDASSGIGKLLAALAAGASGPLIGKALGAMGGSVAPPQLSQLLQMGVDRATTQTPLFNAMTSGAYQMLPDFAKTGGGTPQMPPPPRLGGGSWPQ